MKKIIFLLSIIVILFSCNKVSDKKVELAKLVKERDKLNEKIAVLEKEIVASGDSATYKYKVVTVLNVANQEFNHYIEVQGRVDGDENIAVTATMGGQIQKVYVKEGQSVKVGQLLAELDASVLKKNLTQVESQLVFVKDVYEKQKALWEQKIGSEIQYLTAKNNKESLENSINALKEQIELSRIKSPINGNIEELSLKVGQMAAPGYPLLRVVNLSTLKVVADVSESFSAKINKGDEVIVFFPDIKHETKTNVSFASKYINPINRTFVVETYLTNDNVPYRANMIAVVKVNDYKNKSAIVVPVNVVQKMNDKNFVFVVKTEKNKSIASKQDVILGISYNGLVEITSGLAENDKVISMGYQNLLDGELIKF